MPFRQRLELTFITATTLPLLIARLRSVSTTGHAAGERGGHGWRGRGVGAGFPAAAVTLNRRALRREFGDPVPDSAGVTENEMADGDAIGGRGNPNGPGPVVAGETRPDLDGERCD